MRSSPAVLTVESLDRQIRRVLLDRIIAGEIPPGANLNETRLAGELGASRTPLRQALARLEQDGFLVVEPNRGFFVAPLSADEAREIYPILAALETAALRTAPPGKDDIRQLEALNRRLAGSDAGGLEAIATVNLEWHALLVARCPNQRLLTMLATLRQQAFRYEVAFFSPGAARLTTSVKLHRWILAALKRSDVEEACRRLDAHWAADLDTIVPASLAAETPSEGGTRRRA